MSYLCGTTSSSPSRDFVPGHSSWRRGPEQAGRRRAAGAFHPRRGRAAVDVRAGTPGVRPDPAQFRLRRGGHGRGHRGARERRGGQPGERLQRGGRARGAAPGGVLRAGTVESTSDFIVGAPEDGLLVQRPADAARAPGPGGHARRPCSATGASGHAGVTSSSTSTRPTGRGSRRCAAGPRGEPGFADAFAAHARGGGRLPLGHRGPGDRPRGGPGPSRGLRRVGDLV